MKAKKSYGQHFLNNEVIAARIADSLLLTADYGDVIEVGPGQGVLTKYLLDRLFVLYAVEADQDMVAHLKVHYPNLEPRLVHKDFLKLQLEELVGNRPFAIIGNFPYNISSQIVFKMLDYKAQVPELVGMFQKEMAERVVAPPGGKDYGVISALVQAFYEGKLLFSVKAGHFNPPPKVTSAVIRLTRKENQELGCDPKLYTKVVKQAFSQRRKMLRNTMKSFLGDHAMLKEAFFELRPERLGVSEFVNLTNRISNELEEQKLIQNQH
ncbi:MAG: ribosomal RNA small subunit methyltransferase A [Saprospiraceae bacterium]|nr:ribosomal RNA small subunit methyltransferase A [Saprospiraceae bacterium]